MKIKFVILLGLALLLSSPQFDQAQYKPSSPPTSGSQGPGGLTEGAQNEQGSKPSLGHTNGQMTEKEVITELKKQGAAQLLTDLSKRGVEFEMNPDIEKKLRKANASDDVIKAVKDAGPKERSAAAREAAIASGALILKPEEEADFKVLQSELDPDKAIALAEAFEKKYPTSPALSYVYEYEAHSYETKNKADKTAEFAEKSIALKKDNLASLLMAAEAIPQQFIHQHPADEEQQLDKAKTYAQEALKASDTLKKAPTEQDADFAERKATYLANAHSALGMIHLDLAQLGLMSLDMTELDKAVDEYKLAVSVTQHPFAPDYYRLGDVYRLQGKNDDAIAAYTKASEIGQGVKPYADKQIEALKKAKAQSGAAAKP